jgi:hypothetical protein
MPYLSPEDRRLLLGPIAFECPRCHTQKTKNYCRSCDEFFHTCACPRTEHLGHRTYLGDGTTEERAHG